MKFLIFSSFRFDWDSEQQHMLSPWDLEPIDEERRPTNVGDPVPVMPNEVLTKLYRPRPEDWGGDRDTECNRISDGLRKVMILPASKPFTSPVDLNLHPSYGSIVGYPMDLSIIKSRVDNRFYRRISAVEFDIRFIFTNAGKFFDPKSDIVRSAAVITDLCLEIIRKRDAVNVRALYQQLLKKSKIRKE